MTVSKIDFFGCLSGIYCNWREQSHSLFENLKHNRIKNVIIQLVGGKYVCSVCCYVCRDNESLIDVDILRNVISLCSRLSDCKSVVNV
jgi:hypothetical protein